MRVERVLWILVGLGFGVGLYLMRRSTALSEEEHLLAIGFAIVETVAVLLLDLYAAGLRRKWRRYEEQIEPFRAAENQVLAAQDYLHGREHALDMCRDRADAHVDQVREREHLVRAAPLIREAARTAVEAGYKKGLAENRGHVDDAAFLPPVAAEVRGRSRRGAHRSNGSRSHAAPAAGWRRRS